MTLNSTPTAATVRAYPLILAAATTAIALLITACGSTSTSSSTESSVTTTIAKSTTSTQTGQTMRGKRYCEVLLTTIVDGNATAEVYNSYTLNDCPEDLWNALDAKAIASAEGVPLAERWLRRPDQEGLWWHRDVPPGIGGHWTNGRGH